MRAGIRLALIRHDYSHHRGAEDGSVSKETWNRRRRRKGQDFQQGPFRYPNAEQCIRFVAGKSERASQSQPDVGKSGQCLGLGRLPALPPRLLFHGKGRLGGGPTGHER